MTYPARRSYRDPVVANAYDKERFNSWHGLFVDRKEKRLVSRGLRELCGDSLRLVVDAPVGTGRVAKELLSQGYRVVGVDLSVAMMVAGEASRELTEHPGFVGYVCADVGNMPFQAGCVDSIVCVRLMGHLPHPAKRAALSEFRRVARLGAVVVMSRDSLLLKAKRTLYYLLRFKARPKAWFPLAHADCEVMFKQLGWHESSWADLFRFLSESRVYVLRRD